MICHILFQRKEKKEGSNLKFQLNFIKFWICHCTYVHANRSYIGSPPGSVWEHDSTGISSLALVTECNFLRL